MVLVFWFGWRCWVLICYDFWTGSGNCLLLDGLLFDLLCWFAMLVCLVFANGVMLCLFTWCFADLLLLIGLLVWVYEVKCICIIGYWFGCLCALFYVIFWLRLCLGGDGLFTWLFGWVLVLVLLVRLCIDWFISLCYCLFMLMWVMFWCRFTLLFAVDIVLVCEYVGFWLVNAVCCVCAILFCCFALTCLPFA